MKSRISLLSLAFPLFPSVPCSFPQVRQQYFHRQPSAGEDDRLHAGVDQVGGDALGFQQAGAAQAQLGIYQWRVVEDDVTLALGRAVSVDQCDRRLDQPFGQSGRVGDGG